MKAFLAIPAIIGILATPALAVPISKHRAEAIQDCQSQADAIYGPSGVRDWRRFDHDYYAQCMFSKGEQE